MHRCLLADSIVPLRRTNAFIRVFVFVLFFIFIIYLLLSPSLALSPLRAAGHPSQRRDHRGFPQGAGAEDPQQFPGVQLGHGRHWYLHERHSRSVLQLPEVSDVTAPVSQ